MAILLDRLDPALLRRFAFKIRFDCLNRDQYQQLFYTKLARLALGACLATASIIKLDRLDKLPPGNFAAVARQWALCVTQQSAEAQITALEAECSNKGGGGRTIGFVT